MWLRHVFRRRLATSAYALAERARHCGDDNGDKLFARACSRFSSLHRDVPTYVPALTFWAAALTNRAPKLRAALAEEMREEAKEKLLLALELAPNDVDILAALVSVLERLAWLKPPEVAAPLLRRARDLVEDGLSRRPHHPHLLNVCSMVLYGRVHAVPEADLDRRLTEARDTFKAEYRYTPMASIVNGWGTVLFAQADRSTGTTAEHLLREAKEKYAEGLERDPKSSEYNLACVCARLGEFDECRQWLQRSGEPGRYVTREEMAADPELIDVRDHAWFRALVPQ